MEHLAAGTVELQRLFDAHGYREGIIFGHALDGNLHFVFTQDFADPAEVDRYRRFMDEVCQLVAVRFGGSLKGEHGTGRNMAPFVELEWGAKATGIMRRVKALLDPERLLNPGVLLNDDPQVHLKHLKGMPPRARPRGPLHGVRVLRAALPVAGAHAHAPPADHRPARDRAPRRGGRPGAARAARARLRLARRRHLRRGRALRDRLPRRDRHRQAHEGAARRGALQVRGGARRPRRAPLRVDHSGRARRARRDAGGPAPAGPPRARSRGPPAGRSRTSSAGATGRWSTSRRASPARWVPRPATRTRARSPPRCSPSSTRRATTSASRPISRRSAAACPSSRRGSRGSPTRRRASSSARSSPRARAGSSRSSATRARARSA